MALTAIDVATAAVSGGSASQIPRVLAAAVAVTNNNTLGFQFTNSGGKERYVELASQDGAWFWHDVDAQANTACRQVGIGQPWGVQVPGGATISLYCRSASTTNIVATVER